MKVDLDDFNPRSHEGSDSGTGHVVSTTDIFQSTLPRGERPCRWMYMDIIPTYFNPRSHEGSDVPWIHHSQEVIVISIHAPTRGATFIALVSSLSYGFQSTLPRGERQQRDQRHSRNCYFNPRSHEGSDNTNDFYRICA